MHLTFFITKKAAETTFKLSLDFARIKTSMFDIHNQGNTAQLLQICKLIRRQGYQDIPLMSTTLPQNTNIFIRYLLTAVQN